MDPLRRYRLLRRSRLSRRRDYDAVFSGGQRKIVGPLVVLALPNELGHPRLGLAVPRRVGTAVRRNRIKRLIREAFRSMQHDLPRGYDLVVNVRPHEPMTLAEYQRSLSKAVTSLHRRWTTSNDT